jgi:hypothetical protein
MDVGSILAKYNALPAELKKQVEDFIDFMVQKSKEGGVKAPEKKKRVAGLAKGMIKMMPDFDEPLEDFKEYM